MSLMVERRRRGEKRPQGGKKMSLMVGGRRRGEKRVRGLGHPPILPRLLPGNDVAVASETTCSFRLPDKTQPAPDRFCCHSCGRRFPSDEDGGDHIVHLRSQWRVLLLCGVCLDRVKSAALCSYCFSPIADVERSLSCLRCSRQVHLRCGDLEHRCIGPWRLDPGSFACIDCCAVQNRRGRNLVQEARVCPEKVVTEASFVAERASYASDVVPVSEQETPERNKCSKKWIDDDNLAALTEDPGIDCIASDCERKIYQKYDIPKPDKYLKKYSRRRLSRLKGLADQTTSCSKV